MKSSKERDKSWCVEVWIQYWLINQIQAAGSRRWTVEFCC